MSHAIAKPQGWGGGTSPLGTSHGKLFMWFFLISDALTFSGLLVALGFFRHKYALEWPVSTEVFTHFPFTHAHLPLIYVGWMTFDLILSSVTMVLAVEAGHRKDKKAVILWMGLTILGGFIFLGSQVWEWWIFIEGSVDGKMVYQLIDGVWQLAPFRGANLTYNEYAVTPGGVSLPHYADFFFCVTGFHGFHVFSGVVINIVAFIMAYTGVFERRGHYEFIEKVGLYWHFVDLVWVFVFTFFYLL
jgi:cytochrome c oxidase subunit III